VMPPKRNETKMPKFLEHIAIWWPKMKIDRSASWSHIGGPYVLLMVPAMDISVEFPVFMKNGYSKTGGIINRRINILMIVSQCPAMKTENEVSKRSYLPIPYHRTEKIRASFPYIFSDSGKSCIKLILLYIGI